MGTSRLGGAFFRNEKAEANDDDNVKGYKDKACSQSVPLEAGFLEEEKKKRALPNSLGIEWEVFPVHIARCSRRMDTTHTLEVRHALRQAIITKWIPMHNLLSRKGGRRIAPPLPQG